MSWPAKWRHSLSVLSLAVSLVLVMAAPASAHQLSAQWLPFEDGDHCEVATAITDHGSDVSAVQPKDQLGVFVVGAQTTQPLPLYPAGQVDCQEPWARSIRLRIAVQYVPWTAGNFDNPYLCAWSGWVEGPASAYTWWVWYSQDFNSAFCGPGFYRTGGLAQMKLGSHWEGDQDGLRYVHWHQGWHFFPVNLACALGGELDPSLCDLT